MFIYMYTWAKRQFASGRRGDLGPLEPTERLPRQSTLIEEMCVHIYIYIYIHIHIYIYIRERERKRNKQINIDKYIEIDRNI